MVDNPLLSVDPAVIGERLAVARRARGLTQQQAAEALGVGRTTITAMEKGERRPSRGGTVFPRPTLWTPDR